MVHCSTEQSLWISILISVLHSNIVRLHLCRHIQTIKSSECLYYRVHFRVRKATHSRPLPLYGWVIGKRLSLVYNSIVYSIERNGMESNASNFASSSLQSRMPKVANHCSAITFFFYLFTPFRCVSICTEALFIHQSSHFPSLFCHYR